MDLSDVRKNIDRVDGEIRRLFVERMTLADQVACIKAKTEDKIYNAIGTLFGIMSTITTGKQDYRAVNVYRNRDDYSKATRGMGRVLNYMK